MPLKSKVALSDPDADRGKQATLTSPDVPVERNGASQEVEVGAVNPAETEQAIAVRPILDPGLVPGHMSKSGFVPTGHVEVVECNVYPDFPLKVGFNTSIAYRIIRDKYRGAGATELEQECRRVALIVPVFQNWNVIDPLDKTPIPVPDPTHWETYKPIVSAAGLVSDLYLWLMTEGLTKALRQASGNS